MVLTPNKITTVNAARMADYFLDLGVQRNRGDYYAGPAGEAVESPGRWLGATALGVEGEITLEQLLNLLDGRHPITGKRIVPWKADRIAAQDFTFSAPKDVSIVWAVGDAETQAGIDAAQAAAVAEAHAWITRHLEVVRRRADRGDSGRGREGNPIITETAAAVIGAAFAHHTSRQSQMQAAAGIPPDPQVHTHLLLAMAQRHDGRMAAIHSRALYKHLQEIDAVYLAGLAAGLAEMGFEIVRGTGRGGRFFEIAGVPASLRADWSSRTAEIEELRPELVRKFRARYGRDPTTIELGNLTVRHRIAKGAGHPAPREWWRRVGAEHGVTEDTILALRSRGAGLPPPSVGREQLASELLGDDGLTKDHAVVTTAKLRAVMFRRAAGILTVADTEELLTQLTASGDLVSLGGERWTTRGMLEIERGVLAWHERRRDRPPPRRATQHQVWTALQTVRQQRNLTLTDEQREALRLILGQGFTAVTGAAGTGKGVVLTAAAHVWRAQDRRVFALAVAGATAQRLAADLGDGAIAMPLQGFLTRLQHDRIELHPTDVIVVDEAGMVGSRQWGRFADAVGDVADVTLLGDHAQLSALSAGGLWPKLAANGPRLHAVQRTRVAWEQRGWDLWRRGATQEALATYARHGHVRLTATREEAVSAAVAAWNADGRTGLIITIASNAERHTANIQAQVYKAAAGELGTEAAVIRTAHGDVTLHGGDQVIFRAQWRIPKAQRVENGTTGAVVAVDPARGTLTVRTDEARPRELAMPVGEASGLLDLGYAAHVYKAQGATVDRAYVIAGGWQTDREALYVACSRSRHGTRLFLDRESLGEELDAEALAVMSQRGSRSRAKTAACTHLPHLPGIAAMADEQAQEPRKRGRRILHSREPLVQRYQKQERRRTERAAGRRQRAGAAYGEQSANRARRRTVEALAADAGVPNWVVRTFQAITGIRYDLRQ